MKSRRFYVNVLELHENMTQILHVNTQTAKTLRELQKLMHDVHGRFEALHDERLQTEFNTRLQAVEKLLERWDTALAQQMHGDLGNVIQTLERLCQLVRHHDDEDAANIRECRDLGRAMLQQSRVLEALIRADPFPSPPIRECRDLGRAMLQQSRVLEALIRADPFPSPPVRYRRPPISDA
eukprot:s2304_g18.t1